MMICKQTGCPHPTRLPEFGIGIPEYLDWYGFFLWENDDEEHDDSEKIAYLDWFEQEFGD